MKAKVDLPYVDRLKQVNPLLPSVVIREPQKQGKTRAALGYRCIPGDGTNVVGDEGEVQDDAGDGADRGTGSLSGDAGRAAEATNLGPFRRPGSEPLLLPCGVNVNAASMEHMLTHSATAVRQAGLVFVDAHLIANHSTNHSPRRTDASSEAAKWRSFLEALGCVELGSLVSVHLSGMARTHSDILKFSTSMYTGLGPGCRAIIY